MIPEEHLLLKLRRQSYLATVGVTLQKLHGSLLGLKQNELDSELLPILNFLSNPLVNESEALRTKNMYIISVKMYSAFLLQYFTFITFIKLPTSPPKL